jgi:hypothetical protein
MGLPHLIYFHSHEFFVLAQDAGAAFDSSVKLNIDNPPRRDVATLCLVIAFFMDNPGT